MILYRIDHSRRDEPHVRVSVFCGSRRGALGLAGQLCFDRESWREMFRFIRTNFIVTLPDSSDNHVSKPFEGDIHGMDPEEIAAELNARGPFTYE